MPIQRSLLLWIWWLFIFHVHASEWSFITSIAQFIYRRNFYEWTDSKIQGCYTLLIHVAISCNHIESCHIISDLKFATSKRAISIR